MKRDAAEFEFSNYGFESTVGVPWRPRRNCGREHCIGRLWNSLEEADVMGSNTARSAVAGAAIYLRHYLFAAWQMESHRGVPRRTAGLLGLPEPAVHPDSGCRSRAPLPVLERLVHQVMAGPTVELPGGETPIVRTVRRERVAGFLRAVDARKDAPTLRPRRQRPCGPFGSRARPPTGPGGFPRADRRQGRSGVRERPGGSPSGATAGRAKGWRWSAGAVPSPAGARTETAV